MLNIEQELAGAIYLFYAVECTHWLKPGEVGMTRRLAGGWKIYIHREDSFTLLGRMPVVVNPIDFRPSYMAGPDEWSDAAAAQMEEMAVRSAPDTRLITTISILGAANLLVFLPALLLSGFLGPWWRVVLSIALFTQMSLACEFFGVMATWRRKAPSAFWREFIPLLLNPVAAIRSGDFILNMLCTLQRHEDMSN
ncbi:MAG TPA: hypothetical protein VE291_02565 [Terracidiphilus sp.]|jgi:hypothetical protein|nr:hypothetical protein [Terracidiphilus sp.]